VWWGGGGVGGVLDSSVNKSMNPLVEYHGQQLTGNEEKLVAHSHRLSAAYRFERRRLPWRRHIEGVEQNSYVVPQPSCLDARLVATLLDPYRVMELAL